MPLLLLNARTGRLEEPRHGGLAVAFADEWRAAVLSGPILAACGELGFSVTRVAAARADVFVGQSAPACGGPLWLKLGPLEGSALDGPAASWLCWKTAYGRPLSLSRAALAEAERELAWLRARREELSQAPAPNDSALAGYWQRLRQALARDFDAPRAWTCLSAALRPGALSPGTQAAFLRRFGEIFPVS